METVYYTDALDIPTRLSELINPLDFIEIKDDATNQVQRYVSVTRKPKHTRVVKKYSGVVTLQEIHILR
jgi:hypothetical protein